jgi:protein phosphatase
MAIIYDPGSAPTDPAIDLSPKPWPPSFIEIAFLQDQGTRPKQEDSVDGDVVGGGEWGFVGDGIARRPAGEYAAELGRKLMRTWCHSQFPAEDTPSAEVEKRMHDQVVATNEEIRREAWADSTKSGMGATFVWFLRVGKVGYVESGGDSRAYFSNKKYLLRLTEDQVILITDPVTNLPTNAVTSALGALRDTYQNAFSLYDKMEDEGFVLLCSDGLYKVVSDEEICDILALGGTAKDLCQKLMDAVKAKGKAKLDNVTILIIRYQRPAAAPTAA